jgi:hypothetical protein
MAEVFLGTASSWLDLLDAVEKYYGEGSPQWEAIRSKTISQTEFNNVMKQLPYVDTVTNQNGDVMQYRVWSNYEINQANVGSNASQTVNEINSNVQTTTVEKTSIPMNTTVVTDPVTQETSVQVEMGGETVVGGATATATAFTLKDKILPAMFAVGILATLGKITKPELYSELPHFFDLDNIKEQDVEKWKTFTDDLDQITGLRVINPTDPTFSTSYITEDAYSYLLKYLIEQGAFNQSGRTIDDPSAIGLDIPDWFMPFPVSSGVAHGVSIDHPDRQFTVNFNTGNPLYTIANYRNEKVFYFASEEYFTVNPTGWASGNFGSSRTTLNNKTFYYLALAITDSTFIVDKATQNFTDKSSLTSNQDISVCYAVLYGYDVSAVNGIEQETGATTPSFNTGMSYAEILAQLQADYPTLFDNAVTQNVVQPDGSVKQYTYLPVVMPTPNPNPTTGFDPQEQPISGTQRQADTEVDPENTPEVIIQYLWQSATDPRTPDKEDTGEGTTPPAVIPTGSASALYTVYNPTNAEINSFGSWLWSANFVDQLLKMFNDPMQAIISLHKVFCSPSVSGRNNIKVGYLDSGVAANVVSAQYVTVDCGSVNLAEDYKNVFDYPPFTDVNLYMPFVGFVRLDTNDVMRGSINVVYHVDVLTGACLAEVKVTRDSSGGVIYQYSGDCSVHYPLSSGSYMGIVSALLGVAGTVVSGGALAPMAIGMAAGAMRGHANVERSGSLSGNAGAMGIKKPYLVIQRPQINTPSEFEKFMGKPSNYTVTIGECTGYIKCKEVHVFNTPATESETQELVSLLKEGVIL